MKIYKTLSFGAALIAALALAPLAAEAKPGAAGAKPSGKPSAAPAFNRAAGAGTGRTSVRTTTATTPRPAPKSLAPTSLKFSQASGAKSPKIVPMNISPKGHIVRDSRVPRFNVAAGAPLRALPPLKSLTTQTGQSFAVPQGAKGPVQLRSNKGKGSPNGGVALTGGSGAASTIRVMPPRAAKGKAPAYPFGYVTYANKHGQTVHPQTGKTLKPTDPAAHIPIRP